MRLNIEWDVMVAMFSMMAMLLKTAPGQRNIIKMIVMIRIIIVNSIIILKMVLASI